MRTRILTAAAMVLGLGALALPGVGFAEPPPSLRIDDVSVAEGDLGHTPAIFTVSLDRPAAGTVTVQYQTAPASALEDWDFVPIEGTLAFSPGETRKQITVDVVGDIAPEPDEGYLVDLKNVNAEASIADGTGFGMILNDDEVGKQPAFSIDDVTVPEGDSDTKHIAFKISLSAKPTSVVMVDYATADGTATASDDYLPSGGTVILGPRETSMHVLVGIRGDTEVELDERFTVELSNAQGATIDDPSGTGTILDDDFEPPPLPVLSIDNTFVEEGDSGQRSAVLKVSLSEWSASTVTVDYATVDETATAPDDYVSTSGTLTFDSGEQSKFVMVEVVGDTEVEIDEELTVELSNARGATIGDSSGGIIITDDDDAVESPKLRISDVTVNEGDAGSTPATFTVTMDKPSDEIVQVHFGTNDGTATSPDDYALLSGTRVFNPGETSKEIPIDVVGDTVSEGDETFTVELSNPSGATIDDPSGTGTITNDDEGTPPPNEPPVAEDASIEATQGRPELAQIDASDPEGEPLTYTVDQSPEHGQVTGDGPEFSYTADGDYTGADGFTVEVCDAAGACDTAEVTVAVKAYQLPSEPPSEADELSVDPSTAKRGQDIEVSGSGFGPGEWVFLVLHSDPERLGVVQAGDDGSIATTITVPTDAELGEHVVAAYGEASALAGDLTVVAAKKPGTDKPGDKEPGETPGTEPPGGNGGQSPGASGTESGTKLALTGAAGIPLLLGIGTVLLITGGVWLGIARRTRRDPD